MHPQDTHGTKARHCQQNQEKMKKRHKMQGPVGEQEAMDDESAYAPSSPAGEDEQDMGLLLVMDVCPSLSRSACREEREELEDIIEETCVLSVVSGKRGNTSSKRQGAHPGDRG